MSIKVEEKPERDVEINRLEHAISLIQAELNTPRQVIIKGDLYEIRFIGLNDCEVRWVGPHKESAP